MEQAAHPPLAVRAGLRPVLALVALACVAHLAGIGFGPLDGFMARWAMLILELGAATACALRAILVAEERRAWTLIAIGVASWALGDTIWRALYYTLAEPPRPSVADLFWFAFYPATYAGIVLLIRDRARHASATVWVDGLIATLAVGAAVVAIVLKAVLEGIGGSAGGTATDLVYVGGDALLLALVLAAFALTGWRLDRAWAWLGGALAVFAVSDSTYLYQVAQGTYSGGGLLDAGWGVALLLVAGAAWYTGPARLAAPRAESWRSIALPIAFGFVALAIEVYDHFTQVSVLALVLATACLGAVLGRLAMTFGENLGMLRATRRQATTDPLTGLGNRRALMTDLSGVLPDAEGAHHLLLLLDLDGFKPFNDEFGHLAGDALLARRGRALAERMATWGRAYRMGGDEFCVLLRVPDGGSPADLCHLAAASLEESRHDYRITSSCGWAALPDEAWDPSRALKLADRRMYAQKGRPRDGGRRREPRPPDRRAAAGLPSPG